MALDQTYLAAFKADLLSLSPEEVFARYVVPDPCRGITDIEQSSLRAQIADHFAIAPRDVVIVGSAKLGFTLRHKPARGDEGERLPFSEFDAGSDVDVAIVSDRLFDDIWKACLRFWHTSGYANAGAYWPTGKHFRTYFFRGWMRPDHLPSEGNFKYKNDWFDFFRRLTNARAAGDYKITAGLYRESHFLKTYQTIAISQCKSGLVFTP